MSSFYFQDANGPAFEAILSFSDLTLLLILPIACVVFFFLFSFCFVTILYRRFTDHQALEFTWTVLPAVLLLALAAPSLSLLYLLDEVGTPLSTTKVQGHQWYWVYESIDIGSLSLESYLSPGSLRLLDTDTTIHVSSQLVLRFLVTAADVLHSWTIPSWGLKADAVPGRLNQLSTFLERTGVFYGQCSEICGSNHSFMPINVEVLPEAKWPYL